MKYAVITGFVGRLQDRFAAYHEPRPIQDKIKTIASVPGVSGVEAIFPYDFADPELLKRALSDYGMGIAAVNLNVKAEPIYARGSFTSEDPAVRRRAVSDLKRAMEAAREFGASRVTACMLSDGHDYPFEVDYKRHWDWMVEGLREGAEHCPDIILSVEYKLAETRVRTTVGTAYKTMILAQDIKTKNIGVTLDTGHALWALETPAESLSMLSSHNIPVYIHLNDNYRDWDWDMVPGTVNPWSLIEFFYYLKRAGYNDWLTFDVFPARMDPVSCFTESVKYVQDLVAAADRLDQGILDSLRAADDVPGILAQLRSAAILR